MTMIIDGSLGIRLPDDTVYWQNATTLSDTNGYHYLPGGLILQWGSFSYNADGPTLVQYNFPFPNNIFNVIALGVQSGGNPNAVTQVTTSGFLFDRIDEVNGISTLFWRAIGN